MLQNLLYVDLLVLCQNHIRQGMGLQLIYIFQVMRLKDNKKHAFFCIYRINTLLLLQLYQWQFYYHQHQPNYKNNMNNNHMKNKKRILIIAFAVIIFLLMLVLAFFAGKATGKKYGEVTYTETTPTPETDKPQNTAVPQATDAPVATTAPQATEAPQTTAAPQPTEAPQATEQPDSKGTLAEKPTEEPSTETGEQEATGKGEFIVYIDSFNSWGDNPVFHQLTAIPTPHR